MGTTRVPPPKVARSRARLGGLHKRPDDDPELARARAEHRQTLRDHDVDQHVREIVESWPAISDEQKHRIAVLLKAPLATVSASTTHSTLAEPGGAA